MAGTFIDQQNGALAFEIFPLQDDILSAFVSRENNYSILLLQSGELDIMIDFLHHSIEAKSIVCLSPYQPHRYARAQGMQGWMLRFHPDFFCTYKHHNDIAVEGALFHNNYQPAFFPVSDDTGLKNILQQLVDESGKQALAQHEILVAYLKIYLINVLRIKTAHEETLQLPSWGAPAVVTRLKDSIERQYRQMHNPSDYAKELNISLKALGKLVKKHFNKTLSGLIAQRIVIEAKRELYLTSKPVKEIAWLLGYADEYYFSRFFKKHSGISPQLYRKTVGFAKAEGLEGGQAIIAQFTTHTPEAALLQ